jgi:hypothetical protein
MGNSFQLYKFLANGIPVSVHKTEELENAVRVAIALAVNVPGHYTVCCGQNASEPILDLDFFEIREENVCLTSEN